MNEKTWSEVARRLSEEQDPEKMLRLCRELDEAMLQEERRRIRVKLEQKRQQPPRQPSG